MWPGGSLDACVLVLSDGRHVSEGVDESRYSDQTVVRGYEHVVRCDVVGQQCAQLAARAQAEGRDEPRDDVRAF
jgi:hypothetical protein